MARLIFSTTDSRCYKLATCEVGMLVHATIPAKCVKAPGLAKLP